MTNKKTYNCDILSISSIKNLQKELESYKITLRQKTDEFVRRLAEVGIPVINSKMNEASVTVDENGVTSGSDSTHYTYVTVKSFGTYSQAVLTVEGNDLLFIEFGAGIHHNKEAGVGGSPNPNGQEFGYTIGSYGKGHGKQETWGYIDDSGALVLTHGTKATMPVYSAGQKIIAEYARIAQEVFGG